MATDRKHDPDLRARALKLWKGGMQPAALSREISIPKRTVEEWVSEWRRNGIERTAGKETPKGPPAVDPREELIKTLRHELRQARVVLNKEKEDALSAEKVRREIFKLSDSAITQPTWLVNDHGKSHRTPGIPTLFASDWHWGEVVDPTQIIGGVNAYGVQIARSRARLLIERTIDLLENHMVNPQYPGIVFALGGDMVSGDIHEELMRTNELDIMPTIVDLIAVLQWCISTLADRFGQVFIPCVTGNHGRNTHKPRSKGRTTTNFDWLVYTMLEKLFANDKRVRFYVPNGSDARYSIYSHRYLLTHGDQFRGGDGMIGALGPIIRGDHKKRSRNMQIDQAYDTLLLGHWHQLIQLQRLIVNGSLKGYDEYAYQGNFPFEPARQALWLTHPQHGITISMPVNVADGEPKPAKEWVKWEVQK